MTRRDLLSTAHGPADLEAHVNGLRFPAFIDPNADVIVSSRMPIVEAMRTEERDAGHTVVRPGERPWLPAEDWSASCVVSEAGREVRIVAVIALRPGSFRRLVAACEASGLVPVVVCPIGPIMPAMLRRWRWTPDAFGLEWRPPAQGPWMPEARR